MVHSILSIDLYGPADPAISAAVGCGLLVPVFDRGAGYYAANPLTPDSLQAFARALSAAGAAQPQGELEATVRELTKLARAAPNVTEHDILEIASMPVEELRRRHIRQRDWHGHFNRSLDGIPEIRNMPGAAPDGCWSHKEVRAVVTGLLAKLAAQPQGDSNG